MPLDRLTLSFRNGTPPTGTLVNDSDLNQMVARINDLVDQNNLKDNTIAALQQQVKPLYVTARATGFTVDYSGVSECRFSDGSVQSIASGSIAVLASATNYVFVNDLTKAVQTNTTGYPVICVPMAEITTSASQVTQVKNRPQIVTSGLTNRPILDCIKNGNLTVAGGSDVNITNWTKTTDAINIFDASTGIITIPSQLKFMRLSVQAIFESTVNAAIASKLRLYQIGSPDTEVNFAEQSGTIAISGSRVTVNFFWLNSEVQPLVTGSSYRLKAFLPSGQSANILGSAITRLLIDRVG